MLTAEQKAKRKPLTGTFFNGLMKGTADIIMNTWRREVGDPSYVEEERKESWPFLFGSIVEPVALDWHERKTQNEITRRGEVVFHPHLEYVSVTLDGMMAALGKVIDCKAYSSFYPADQIVADCTPQLYAQRACTGALLMSVLLVHGGGEPAEYPVDYDPNYDALLWQRVEQFWWCVENLVPPLDRSDLIKPITPPEKWTRIDLDAADVEQPNWAAEMRDALITWDQNKGAADVYEAAKTLIKKLMPDDCARVSATGIVATRARNMAVTIKRERVKA